MQHSRLLLQNLYSCHLVCLKDGISILEPSVFGGDGQKREKPVMPGCPPGPPGPPGPSGPEVRPLLQNKKLILAAA